MYIVSFDFDVHDRIVNHCDQYLRTECTPRATQLAKSSIQMLVESDLDLPRIERGGRLQRDARQMNAHVEGVSGRKKMPSQMKMTKSKTFDQLNNEQLSKRVFKKSEDEVSYKGGSDKIQNKAATRIISEKQHYEQSSKGGFLKEQDKPLYHNPNDAPSDGTKNYEKDLIQRLATFQTKEGDVNVTSGTKALALDEHDNFIKRCDTPKRQAWTKSSEKIEDEEPNSGARSYVRKNKPKRPNTADLESKAEVTESNVIEVIRLHEDVGLSYLEPVDYPHIVAVNSTPSELKRENVEVLNAHVEPPSGIEISDASVLSDHPLQLKRHSGERIKETFGRTESKIYENGS